MAEEVLPEKVVGGDAVGVWQLENTGGGVAQNTLLTSYPQPELEVVEEGVGVTAAVGEKVANEALGIAELRALRVRFTD